MTPTCLQPMERTRNHLQRCVQALVPEDEGTVPQPAYRRYLSSLQDVLLSTSSTPSLANWRTVQPQQDHDDQLKPHGMLVAGLQQALRNLLACEAAPQGCTSTLMKTFAAQSPALVGQTCLDATCKVLAQNRHQSAAYPSILAAVCRSLDQLQETDRVRVFSKLLSSTVNSCQGLGLPTIFSLLQRLHAAYLEFRPAPLGSLCFLLQVQLLKGCASDGLDQPLLTSEIVESWIASAFFFCSQPAQSVASSTPDGEEPDETSSQFSAIISQAASRSMCLTDLCTQLATLNASPAVPLLKMQLGSSPVNEHTFAALLGEHSLSLKLDQTITQSLLNLFQRTSHRLLLLALAKLFLRGFQDPRGLDKRNIAEVGLGTLAQQWSCWHHVRPSQILVKHLQYCVMRLEPWSALGTTVAMM